MNNSYVFVVGMPRSGTTILTGILANHPNIVCGPETQFFNKFSKIWRFFSLIDPLWPRLAVTRLNKITLSNQKVCELYSGGNSLTISRYLSKRERNTKNLFNALISESLNTEVGDVILEKTPNHLLHVGEIRKSFPGSKIIRIVRDPRASALSMCKLPWANSCPIENSKIISRWYRNSKNFFGDRNKDHLTVKYEDFIDNTPFVINEILSFSGLHYDPNILDLSASNSVVTPNEPWKNQVFGGINKRLSNSWCENIDENQFLAITDICKLFIDDFGYPLEKEG
jgi:hypothetical protein